MLQDKNIRAVIFDWGGTVVDQGSRAPVEAFVELFASDGVTVSEQEAVKPMGLAKRDHLAVMLESPAVVEAWRTAHGRDPHADDIDRLYARFPEIQIEAIRRRHDLIPGVLDLCAQLRAREIRIGTTTGFAQQMMAVLTPLAAGLGFEPDCVVCGDEVSQGRPAPWMLFEAARRLDVYPPESIVNVDDTVHGIRAGRNAGMWSIGVFASGATDAETLQAAGAHQVIPSVADLPGLLW